VLGLGGGRSPLVFRPNVSTKLEVGRPGEVGGCDLGFGRRGGGQRLLRFEAVSGWRFSYPEVWSEEMLNPVLVLQT
jgi:hypothetical protein